MDKEFKPLIVFTKIKDVNQIINVIAPDVCGHKPIDPSFRRDLPAFGSQAELPTVKFLFAAHQELPELPDGQTKSPVDLF